MLAHIDRIGSECIWGQYFINNKCDGSSHLLCVSDSHLRCMFSTHKVSDLMAGRDMVTLLNLLSRGQDTIMSFFSCGDYEF